MITTEKTDVIFKEVQRFGLWIRLFLVFLMVAVAVIECFVLKSMLAKPNPPGSGSVAVLVILGICSPLVLCVLFWGVKLETEVRSDGLYIRFFPFHFSFKKIPLEDLHEYYARTYQPIMECGGWGIRYSFGFKSKVYNTSGNRGVQLIFKNGKKLLLGSQKPDEFVDAIGLFKQNMP